MRAFGFLLFCALSATGFGSVRPLPDAPWKPESSEISRISLKDKIDLGFDGQKRILTIRYHLSSTDGCGARIVRYQLERGVGEKRGAISFDTAPKSQSGKVCSKALRAATVTIKVRDFSGSSSLIINGQDRGLILLKEGVVGQGISFETNHEIEKT